MRQHLVRMEVVLRTTRLLRPWLLLLVLLATIIRRILMIRNNCDAISCHTLY